jgi:DNA-binding PadR family transcriptional regulator
MRRKELPALTHLQFLVLGVLRANEQPGRVIREAIATYGVRRSGPAFYQMMARLERDGLVEGWYEQVIAGGRAGGQAVKERRYRIKPAGARLWSATQSFYESVSGAAARPRWSNA